MKIFILIFFLATIIGCAKSTDSKTNSKKQPSMVDEMIDGATGMTAVRHGKKAMETIEQVTQKKTLELEEVLGE